MSTVALIVHAVIVVSLIIAGSVLQATGNDPLVVWGLLGGYLGGVGSTSGLVKAGDG